MDVELFFDNSPTYCNNNVDNTDDDRMDIEILCNETEPWTCVNCDSHILYTITNESLYGSLVHIVDNFSHTSHGGYMHLPYTELDRELSKRRLLFNGVTICKEADVEEVSRCGLNFVRVREPDCIEMHLSKNPLVDNIVFLCGTTMSSPTDYCRFVVQPNIEKMFAPLTASVLAAIYLTHKAKFCETYDKCFTYTELISIFQDNERLYTAVRDIRCGEFEQVRTTVDTIKEEALSTMERTDTSEAIDTIIDILNQATSTKAVVLPTHEVTSIELNAIVRDLNSAFTSANSLIENLQTLEFEPNITEKEFVRMIQSEYNNFTETSSILTRNVHPAIRSAFEQYILRQPIAIFDVLQHVNATTSLVVDAYQTEFSGRASSILKQHLKHFNQIKKAEESSSVALVELVNRYTCPLQNAFELKYKEFQTLYNTFYRNKDAFCQRYAIIRTDRERQIEASADRMFYFWQTLHRSSMNDLTETNWNQMLKFVQNATLSRNDLDLYKAYELFPHDHVADQSATIAAVCSTYVTQIFECSGTEANGLYWEIKNKLPTIVEQMNQMQKLYRCFTIGTSSTVLDYDEMSTLSLYIPKVVTAADSVASCLQNDTQLKSVCRECYEYSRDFLASINLESDQNHVLNHTINQFSVEGFKAYNVHVAATHRLWQLFADLWNKHLYNPYVKLAAERNCIDVFVKKLRQYQAYITGDDQRQIYECFAYADRELFRNTDSERIKATVLYELFVGKACYVMHGIHHRYSELQTFTEEDWSLFYDMVKKYKLVFSSDSTAYDSTIVSEQIVTTLLQEYFDKTFVFSQWWSFIVDSLFNKNEHMTDLSHRQETGEQIDMNTTYTVTVQDSDKNGILKRDDFSPFHFNISTDKQQILKIYRELGCSLKHIFATLLQLPHTRFPQFRYLKISPGIPSAVLSLSNTYRDSSVFVTGLLDNTKMCSGVDYLKLFILLFCFKNAGLQNILKLTGSVDPNSVWYTEGKAHPATEGQKLVHVLSRVLFLNVTTESVSVRETSSEIGHPNSCNIVPVWLLENFCCKHECDVLLDDIDKHDEYFSNTDIHRLLSQISSVKSWSLNHFCCIFLELKNRDTSGLRHLKKLYDIIYSTYTFVLDRLSSFAVIVDDECVKFIPGIETISVDIEYKHETAAYMYIEKNSWTRSKRINNSKSVEHFDSYDDLYDHIADLKLEEYDPHVITQTYFDDEYDSMWNYIGIQKPAKEGQIHSDVFDLSELRHLLTQPTALPLNTDDILLLPLSNELSIPSNSSKKDSTDYISDEEIDELRNHNDDDDDDHDDDDNFLIQNELVPDEIDVHVAVAESQQEGQEADKEEKDDHCGASARRVLENVHEQDNSLLDTKIALQSKQQNVRAQRVCKGALQTRSSVLYISSHDVKRHMLALLERYEDIG